MKIWPKSIGMRIIAVIFPLLACSIMWFSYGAVYYSYSSYEPQEGDIIFQSLPRSAFVNMIEGTSRSELSHCGIVVKSGDDWKVLEAYKPVAEKDLFDWILRGRNGKFAVYRMNNELLN